MLIFFTFSCQNSDDAIYNNDVVESIAPVVIIGGGASGLTTGIRLLELGITPLLLEKETELGGAGIHAGRFFAVDTQWQKELNIVDSTETALEEWIEMTGAHPDDNVQDFILHSSQTLEWIESFDIQFESVQRDIGAGSIPRIHSLSPTSPHPLALWSETLLPYSKLNQTVQGIEQVDDHFIISTNTETYKAEHVVIATGGFARNSEIVLESLPEIDQHNWHMEAWPGMTGDSIEWLRSLTIPLQNMEHIGLYAHGVTDVYLNHPEIMVIPALERSVILNQNGLRVFNEQYTQSLEGGQRMLNEERLYAIFDAPLWQGTTFQGVGYNYPEPPLISSTEFEETGTVFMENDLRDLALTLGMDGTTMTRTLSVYNEGVLSNSDLLGKDVPNLTAVQTPPFYAVELQLSTGKSFGGAEVDLVGHTPIQNLYTIGESAGFLGTTASGWGFSGSITACYYLGKKAAEDIAGHYSR